MVRQNLKPRIILTTSDDPRNGKATEAERDLKASEALALKKGFVLDSQEAKLALGEIGLKVGDPNFGNAQLVQLERNARSRNNGLIARRAADAREKSVPRPPLPTRAVRLNNV